MNIQGAPTASIPRHRYQTFRNHMTTTPSAFSFTLKAPFSESLDSELDRAVQAAIIEALKGGTQGIRVTRHNHTTFTVELADDVAFGTTLEVDLLNRHHAGNRLKEQTRKEANV